MVLTTDVLTSTMYLVFTCITLFFVFNMLKQAIGAVFTGIAGSILSFITAGLYTGTTVVANGVYIGDGGMSQFFTATGFVMFLLTLATAGYPVFTAKKNPEHQL